MSEREYGSDYRLAQNTIVASIIAASYDLDLPCLAVQLREIEAWDSYAPVLFPDEWRSDHRGMSASAQVLRVVMEMAKTCRKLRGPAADWYHYPGEDVAAGEAP